jgi:hypothetical protein
MPVVLVTSIGVTVEAVAVQVALLVMMETSLALAGKATKV